MLNISCPQCRDPIYRLRDGTLLCATCQRPVILKTEELSSKKEEMKSKRDPIQQKILQLSMKLEIEQDPETILELASTIKKLQKMVDDQSSSE